MKKYSTRKIRAVLLMFNAMVNNYEMDYELFNDYTGLKTYSYRNVKRIIREMISDLNLHFNFISISIINITKKTKYYTYKYCLENIGETNYSYRIRYDLEDEKLIDYSMTITYLKLKNGEKVNFKELSNIFPFFNHNKYWTLISWLRDLIDEELYRENKTYKIREFSYE